MNYQKYYNIQLRECPLCGHNVKVKVGRGVVDPTRSDYRPIAKIGIGYPVERLTEGFKGNIKCQFCGLKSPDIYGLYRDEVAKRIETYWNWRITDFPFYKSDDTENIDDEDIECECSRRQFL